MAPSGWSATGLLGGATCARPVETLRRRSMASGAAQCSGGAEMEVQAAGCKSATDDSMPPLMATYAHLLVLDEDSSSSDHETSRRLELELELEDNKADTECDLPVIDLAGLLQQQEGEEAEQCGATIERAASEWGFFMVTNHGVPQAVLDELHEAQVAVFRRPFEVKVREPLLDFSPESYRWGTPTATCLDQLSWSEAYHIPLTTISRAATAAARRTSRQVIEDVSTAMWQLAQRLLRVLTLQLQGDEEENDEEVTMRMCTRDTCFLRLNHYPPCGHDEVFGLSPHTDSDFLTILHQDAVGGLQIRRNSGLWLTVKPRPGTLIVSVGDLLQAWSNEKYRGVEHRVMVNPAQERFSVAFFLCPSYDTLIRPRKCSPPRYRSFTFGEYRDQIAEDVRLTGRKLGLQRFRLPLTSCD